MSRLREFLHNDSGSAGIEYLLAASFIAIGVVLAFNGLSGLTKKPISTAFDTTTSVLGKATDQEPAQPDNRRTYRH